MRRPRVWLCSALVVHVLTLVSTVGAVACGGVRAAAPAAGCIALAVAPLITRLWYERRSPSVNRPDTWPLRAFVTAAPQAVGFAIASTGLFEHTALAPWHRALLLASVPLLLQTAAAVAATRSVRRALPAELGETDLEVRVKIRSVRPGVPRWLTTEAVRLTDQEIVTVVQPGPTWRAMHRMALVDVTAVDARPATADDNPWITLDDGSGYEMTPGDVVVVHHRRGVKALPVYDAAAFADVIRVRAEKVRGAADRAVPPPAISSP